MWEISGYNQYICFWYSIVVGLGLGFLYDLFKFDRTLFKRSKFFVFICDILFWIISAFIVFSFCVVFSNGQIRGYILLGCLLGFLIYKLTLSCIFFGLLFPTKKLIKVVNVRYCLVLEKINLYVSKFIFIVKKNTKKVFFIKKTKNNQII